MMAPSETVTAFALAAAGFLAAALLLINASRELTAALCVPNKHGGLTS